MASFSRFALLRVAAVVALPLLNLHAQGTGDPIFHRYRVLEPTVRKAGDAVMSHHFEEAKRLLVPVLKDVPDHAEAHFLLATMAYQDRDFTGALGHIEMSERSLKDLNQRYSAVLAKREENDAEDARVTQDSLQHLVDAGYDSIDDILGDKRQHLKNIEARKGNLLDAKAAFTVPASYSLLHGNCLFRLGRAAEAAAEYQMAIQADPANTKAWNNLINLYWEQKDLTLARTTLAKAEAAGVMIVPGLKRSVLEAK